MRTRITSRVTFGNSEEPTAFQSKGVHLIAVHLSLEEQHNKLIRVILALGHFMLRTSRLGPHGRRQIEEGGVAGGAAELSAVHGGTHEGVTRHEQAE